MPQFIYTMKDLRKVTPQGKEILQGHLAVVLPRRQDRRPRRTTAPARARCCASWPGVDKDFAGEAFLGRGLHASASCRRSRELDPSKNVREHVEEAVAATRALLARFEELSTKLGEPCRRRDGQAARRAGAPAGPDRRRRTPGSSTASSRSRWTRCGCRRGDADVDEALGRRAAARGALPRPARSSPTCCCSTSRPTTSTPSRSPGSSATSQEYTGTVVAVTHDRYFLDNVAGWILELDRGAGIPWEGNYSSWLEQKEKRLAQEEKEASARQRTLERELEWVRMAPRARQAKGKARLTQLRGAARRGAGGREARRARREITIPPGPAARRPGDRGEGPAQGLRRQAADRRPRLHRCRAAASSASSARTAPARRRSSA